MKQAALAPLFAVPFAAQAQASTITQIPQTSTAIGRASMALGFPASCMTPLAAGGSPPYGQDLNGILNMLSTAAQAAELGMMRPFSASYATAVGGYPAGATVAHPNISGRYLLCTQDGNENDPSVSTAGWLDPMAAFQPAGNYQPAGDYALASALAAEAERAEAAEATLVAKQDFSGNLTDWGYCRLPSGLILQWGNINGAKQPGYFNTGGTAGVNKFPITFPSRCFVVIPGNSGQQGSWCDTAYAYALNNSEFFINTWYAQNSGYAATFLAIGI